MLTRRYALGAAGSLPLFAIGRAHAAEFNFRCGHPLPPAHPLHIRALEASERIAAATDGRVAITLFPESALAPDTDALKMLRAGEIDMMAAFGLVLSTVVPSASIHAAGFAFKTYGQVYEAMDGALGNFVQQDILRNGYVPIGPIWDNGFRQVTTSLKAIRNPDDLHGLKIRVPVSPLSISMFKAFGAEPTGINFSGLHAALLAHTVNAQENSLVLIESAKLFEVQSTCSLTNHMWDGYWLLIHPPTWASLPAAVQEIMRTEFDRAARLQRADMARASPELRGGLVELGMEINPVETEAFQRVLSKAGFYAEWRGKFGDTAWQLLEEKVGALS